MQVRSMPRWWAAVVVLWAAAALLVWATRVTQMHPDETLVYHFTRFDIAYTVNYQTEQDVHPPLWFSFFWLWRQLVGDSEFTGRVQALLFSLLTLAMVYRIGRGWFGTAHAGVFAMSILTVSAYFITYALEIRPYALVMLLASVSMWLFARWLKRNDWRLALAYGVVTAVMFYIHYFSAFLVIVQMLYFLAQRPSRQLLKQGFGAGVVALLLWLPWVPSFFGQVANLRALAQEAGNSYGLGVGTPATTQATSLDTVVKLAQQATNGLPLLYGLVLLLGFVILRRKSEYRLALLWALGVPAVALVLNIVAAVYTPRYIAYMTIGLALAVGAAPAVFKPPAVRSSLFAAFVLLNLWLIPNALPVRPPYRELYAQVSAAARAGDVVLNVSENSSEQFLQWLQQHYLAPELQAGITSDLAQAESARRVWFLTRDWFNPDVRQQFDALEPTHPVQRVIGQCDNSWCYLIQLMEAPPRTEAQRFGENVDFWGVDVDSVTGTEIATRLWWRVEQAPSLDYSISLRLVNAAGEVVAQTDGAINHYNAEIVQTSQLEPGRIYIDWRTLSLPPELSAGVYNLQLVVYQSWDGTRLLLSDGADALTLETLTLS